MRFNPKQPQEEIRVELISMTDIVFLLLIFFMVSTTFVDFSRRLDIQLPETKAAEVAQDVQQHIIEMDTQGTLRLDGQPVRLQELPQRLAPGAESARQRAVIIRADKRLPYGKVVTVLGLVRQAHIRDIAVAVR
ncbi:Tol-Pal system protein TolR [Candidatus Entotheonellaceae bacterium PAL068K]